MKSLLRKLFLKPKGEMAVSIKVIRKDGTVEDLGVVSRTPVEWKVK